MTGRQRGFSLIELLIVVVVSLIATAMAAPSFVSTLRNYRISGDGRDLNGEILTAKMRAASNFTMARVYADTSANTFRIETWDKANECWKTEGAADCTTQLSNSLSGGVSFGYGSLGSPPAGTQATIGQALPCKPGATSVPPGNDPTGGSDITSTACIMFNSRGIPVDNSRAPFADNALYITDTNAVYGVTISATGITRIWRSPAGTVSWQRR
ncbi:MAG: hypothetical protein A3J28_10365 [Acidobacteria bacterium RIFCSPLOWO2_12_FULL_60_22]|nr:MAG: hypothetical protein A3J28_10365 [Acidobacteria bacterium RIFCSPLOWO2_12_FULL_60_22]